jgi:AICAR transformylase/IMP cyclohydrolase PurH
VDQPYESEIDAKAAVIMKDAGPTGIATMSFAIGYYCLVKGYTAKAKEYFEKAVQTRQWSSFGFIAAEAELLKQK